jgi:acetyl-CoA C-acetyltransferase
LTIGRLTLPRGHSGIPANEAAARRFINETVPDGICRERARVIADTISGNSQTAIRSSIEAIDQLDISPSFEDALKRNSAIFGRLFRTKHFREGVTAFAEKCCSNWTGS